MIPDGRHPITIDTLPKVEEGGLLDTFLRNIMGMPSENPMPSIVGAGAGPMPGAGLTTPSAFPPSWQAPITPDTVPSRGSLIGRGQVQLEPPPWDPGPVPPEPRRPQRDFSPEEMLAAEQNLQGILGSQQNIRNAPPEVAPPLPQQNLPPMNRTQAVDALGGPGLGFDPRITSGGPPSGMEGIRRARERSVTSLPPADMPFGTGKSQQSMPGIYRTVPNLSMDDIERGGAMLDRIVGGAPQGGQAPQNDQWMNRLQRTNPALYADMIQKREELKSRGEIFEKGQAGEDRRLGQKMTFDQGLAEIDRMTKMMDAERERNARANESKANRDANAANLNTEINSRQTISGNELAAATARNKTVDDREAADRAARDKQNAEIKRNASTKEIVDNWRSNNDKFLQDEAASIRASGLPKAEQDAQIRAMNTKFDATEAKFRSMVEKHYDTTGGTSGITAPDWRPDPPSPKESVRRSTLAALTPKFDEFNAKAAGTQMPLHAFLGELLASDMSGNQQTLLAAADYLKSKYDQDALDELSDPEKPIPSEISGWSDTRATNARKKASLMWMLNGGKHGQITAPVGGGILGFGSGFGDVTFNKDGSIRSGFTRRNK